MLHRSLVAAMLGSFVAAPAAADIGAIDRRLHMQLQLALVDHHKLSGSIAADEPTADDYQFRIKHTQYGLGSRLAVGLGYGLSENLELMLRTALSVRKDSSRLETSEEETAAATAKVRSVEFLPSLRYVSGEGERRFFVGGGLGYEGSKQHAGRGREGSVRTFVLSGQMGFYCFLSEHVSLDPGFELAFVRGSVRLPGSEQRDDGPSGTGKGVRVLVTLGLSAWLGGVDDGNVAGSEEAVELAYAQPEPSAAPTRASFATARLEGLSLELVGDASRGELQLLVTKHQDGAPPCPVVLLSDHPPEPLEPVWYLNGADEEGPIVTGSAPVTVSQLEHWLAKDPSLAVCGRGQLVRPDLRAELEAGLARFKAAASAASATPPKEGAPTEATATPEVESPSAP